MNLLVTIIIISGVARPAVLGVVPLLIADLACGIDPRSGATTSTSTATATTRRPAATASVLLERTVISASIAMVIASLVTAVTVVPASVVAIIGRTGAPLPGGCIGGGLELRGSRGLEHKLALIIGVYVRVELAERDRRGDHAERGDERVVVDAKASKYVGN
jgi:hypothetical protein